MRADAAAHLRCRGLLRLARKMGVTCRRGYFGVAQQSADHGETLAERECPAGIRMSEVVNPHVVQAGPLPQALPMLVNADQAGARLGASDHPRVVGNARNGSEHAHDRGCERHGSRSCLAIPDADLLRRAVHIVPPQRQDLVQAAPGEHQQPDRRNGVHRRAALCFSLRENAAQAADLVRRQEAFALLLLVPADGTAGIAAGRP